MDLLVVLRRAVDASSPLPAIRDQESSIHVRKRHLGLSEIEQAARIVAAVAQHSERALIPNRCHELLCEYGAV